MVKFSIIVAVIIAIIAVGIVTYFLTTQKSNGKQFVTIKLTQAANDSMKWVPSTVYLKKGEVELTVVNGDDNDVHQLAIPDLGVSTQNISAANGRDTVAFTVNRTGNFTFIDPLAPDWNSPQCRSGQENATGCIPPGQIIAQP